MCGGVRLFDYVAPEPRRALYSIPKTGEIQSAHPTREALFGGPRREKGFQEESYYSMVGATISPQNTAHLQLWFILCFGQSFLGQSSPRKNVGRVRLEGLILQQERCDTPLREPGFVLKQDGRVLRRGSAPSSYPPFS